VHNRRDQPSNAVECIESMQQTRRTVV